MPPDISDLLNSLFPNIAQPPLLDDILAHAQPASLDSGTTICDIGQQCRHLALVTHGSARVYQLAESGREITLYRVEPGECCILTASCIMGRSSFPAIATSESALQGLLIPATQVEQWMVKHSLWRQFIWGLLANRLSNVLCLLEEVAFRRVDQRIASHLLHLSAQTQKPELRVTHQAIADDVGTSREVVSRILKDLEQRAILQLARGQLVIRNQQALGDILCD